MKNVELKTLPKSFLDYKSREKYVKDALFSKSLCRTLLLIINSDKHNRNNKYLAEKYYDTNKSKNMPKKPLPNPKVMSIYLRKLREGHIIKRIEKEGKKQIYDVDWKGIFDILRFYAIEEYEYKDRFMGVSSFFC